MGILESTARENHCNFGQGLAYYRLRKAVLQMSQSPVSMAISGTIWVHCGSGGESRMIVIGVFGRDNFLPFVRNCLFSPSVAQNIAGAGKVFYVGLPLLTPPRSQRQRE